MDDQERDPILDTVDQILDAEDAFLRAWRRQGVLLPEVASRVTREAGAPAREAERHPAERHEADRREASRSDGWRAT